MNAGELVDVIQHLGPSNAKVRLLYGQSELAIVASEFSKDGSDIVLTLDEARDLSDPEKHAG